MPVQQLIGVLEQLTEAHEALVALAEQKKDALVKNEVDSVSAIVNKESRITKTIDGLMKEQAEATNAFFRSRGFQPVRAITITELSRLVFEQETKNELLAARDRLMATLDALKTANQLNQQLIQQSLSFINYSIDLVVGSDDEPVYKNPAMNRNNNSVKRTGYFDSKA